MSEVPLVLLHLSDIHFIKGKSGDAYDLDEPVRNELERDVARSVGGRADALLVSGDIAYGGEIGEYEIARAWLKKVQTIAGCPEGRVWTVPGNHDIHLPVIKDSPSLQTIHSSFRTMAGGDIDAELAKYSRSRDGHQLFAPLVNYNEFAKPLGCDLGPAKPFWKHELSLGDGSVLRVVGFNSVLISSLDDFEGGMILGREQLASMIREPGVEYVTMCHHPVDWCRNKETLDRPLRILPRVLLFGHKHSQDIYSVENGVRVTAGAVHPYRRAPDWCPRYNVLRLSVLLENGRRNLQVDVHPNVWNEQTQRFEPEMHNGQPWKRYSLVLDLWTKADPPVPAPPGPLEVFRINSEPESSAVPDAEAGVNPDVLLANRFSDLPFHRRIAVAVRLGLLEREEEGLPEDETFRRVFRRARDQRLLARLWTDIQAELPVKDTFANPFAE